jgi:Domain of unknown function (DU1801)
MHKTQIPRFGSVGELLAFLPEDQLLITEQLRELCLTCIPDVKEKLSFNVPFYFRYTGICYIWPGAVGWMNKVYPTVEIGFMRGHLLPSKDYLEQHKRKVIYNKRILTLDDLHEDKIRTCLYEAVEIDELLQRERMNRRNKR